MSTIEVNKITPVSGGTTVQVGESGDTINIPAGATIANAGTSTGFGDSLRPNVNPIIINGDMAVSQRSTSVASITSSGYYTVDRIRLGISSLGTWTSTQESLTSGNAYINGFSKAFKIDCTTADGSPGASDSLTISQKFEGQDLQLLKKGTANAEKITVAFWIKATKTGTFIAELYDHDNTRSCSKAYTVSSSNTWEHKVVNFPADTTGALDNDNANSLTLFLWQGAGSNFTSGTLNTSWGSATNSNRAVGQVNNADSTSNNVHITGLQLEVGEYTSATIPPFQHESFDNNLERCQRYFFKNNSVANMPMASGVCNGTTNARAVYYFPKTMRANPSLDKSSSTDFKVQIGGSVHDTTNVAFYYQNLNQALLYVDVSSGLTDGKGCLVIDDGGSNIFISGNAEL